MLMAVLLIQLPASLDRCPYPLRAALQQLCHGSVMPTMHRGSQNSEAGRWGDVKGGAGWMHRIHG